MLTTFIKPNMNHRLVSTVVCIFYEICHFIKKLTQLFVHLFFLFIQKQHTNLLRTLNIDALILFSWKLNFKAKTSNYLNNYNNLNGCSILCVHLYKKKKKRKKCVPYSLDKFSKLTNKKGTVVSKHTLILISWLTGQYLLTYW